MVSTTARTPRTGSPFGSNPLPATFITTPNSFACQAKQSSRMHLVSHPPPRAATFFLSSIFYDVPQCPVGVLRT
jgi:hypothetical protein